MGIIEDLMENDAAGVILDEQVLDPSYVPDEVVGRREQIKAIVPAFTPLNHGRRAAHLLLQGFTGTGKTVTIRWVLRGIQDVIRTKNLEVSVIFVTGTKDMKPNSAMRGLMAAAGIPLTRKDSSINSLMSMFEAHLADLDHPVIVVFDEIDMFLNKPLNEIINTLARENAKTSVVGTTNDLKVLTKINDRRIESAFKPIPVLFPPYTSIELRDILEERAERALYPDVMASEVIPLIAALATKNNGDARYGIQLLSMAAQICVKRGNKRITERDVRDAERKLENEEIKDIKLLLSPRHKAMLSVLYGRVEMRRAELKARYEDKLEESFSIPTFTNDLKVLEGLYLVKLWSRGRGKGKGAEWMVALSEDVTEEKLNELLNGGAS